MPCRGANDEPQISALPVEVLRQREYRPTWLTWVHQVR